MKALIIGRFQPLHNGHVSLIDYAIQHFDFLHIGIGSSQYHDTFENPYTNEQRQEMLKLYFSSQNYSSYAIHSIPDIHDPPNWVSHLTTIISDFEVVITNNTQTKTLFKQAGKNVICPGLQNRQQLKGAFIRTCMLTHQPWEEFVPQSIISYLKSLPITHSLPQPKH